MNFVDIGTLKINVIDESDPHSSSVSVMKGGPFPVVRICNSDVTIWLNESGVDKLIALLQEAKRVMA